MHRVSFFRAIRVTHFWRWFCFGRNSTYQTPKGTGILEPDTERTTGKRPLHQGVLQIPVYDTLKIPKIIIWNSPFHQGNSPQKKRDILNRSLLNSYPLFCTTKIRDNKSDRPSRPFRCQKSDCPRQTNCPVA